MSVVGAREANRSFSKLLKEAESGKTVTITRNGKPVAQLSPLTKQWKSKAEREKAIAEMVKVLEKGLHLGGRRFTRDEMHER
ncbi:MAG TPA: type II toxin-antitoxin system prevent-host-death family antitoxin [Rhizomicrobium sp.]|jgi:prevent-host-death family protein